MRILLADNDDRVCLALTMLIKSQPGWLVVGLSGDVKSLLHRANSLKPDLVVLDWELAGKPNSQTLDALHHLSSKPQVVVISGRPESEQDALQNGADAFVSKVDPPDILLGLLESLHTVAHHSYAEDL